MNYTINIDDAIAELDRFDALLDVRSPGEFAEDHLPGAQNWPVLDDEERRVVGTLYKQDPHAGRRLGATLVARNVARLLEERTADLPKTWRPLVYCWRGGQRSLSLHWFLGQIGFRSRQLVGGYKAYRAQVRDDLEQRPADFRYRVLCGLTGCGKTRLLQALAAEGAQVLDLEGLAAHRGSVLGHLPDRPQPTQKGFDTALWVTLRQLDPARPVFVESESRKIGRIALPAALLAALHGQGRPLWIDLPEAARVELLLQDYAHFAAAPEAFCAALEDLVELRGRARVAAWAAQARSGDWAGVFTALMREHYDPGYAASLQRHFPAVAGTAPLQLADARPDTLRDAARHLIATA
ncbi:tRNA 2-selenouridine(34) synthase MnmH [Roseateles sp.]|uniref:tRNA 2-selenouridine(34) synthase MnmH n=1 Tax=Roseateles sp. TaxID=1971397 RepID=UPI0025DED606|nr:tRNA 2-selenouridine(34) synthase MnmH [Roseateles sp.]MBV8035279.1 tRNA 2-selenouridine(34) synthase MnmH [Roseateles sp.]